MWGQKSEQWLPPWYWLILTGNGHEVGQGGAGNVLYLDPSASYMGFQIHENSTTVHLRFLLSQCSSYIEIFKKSKIRWECGISL